MWSGGAPESWDEDLNTPMSSLNVNATEFGPSGSWGIPPESKIKKLLIESLIEKQKLKKKNRTKIC